MTQVVRVLRLLEYVGTREWVEATLSRNAVQNSHIVPNGGRITSAILGSFPEVVAKHASPGVDNSLPTMTPLTPNFVKQLQQAAMEGHQVPLSAEELLELSRTWLDHHVPAPTVASPPVTLPLPEQRD